MKQADVLMNYLQIKKDIGMIVQTELKRMLNTPELEDLISKKEV